MSQPKNIFDTPLNTALDGLGDLSVTALATRSAMKAANLSVKRTMESFDKMMAKHNKKDAPFFMGATLPVPDYFKSKVWLVSHPHRPRAVVRDDIVALNDEIADRLRCQLVCAGFELLEDYLREVAAQCFFKMRKENRKERLQLSFNRSAFHARNPKLKMDGSENTLPYFQKYTEFAYRSGLSEFLQELAEKLSLSKEQPDYATIMYELIERYRLIEYCRHVTVHEFGRHDPDRLKSLNKWFKTDLISKTSGLTKHRSILISDRTVGELIQIMAGIAYHVYRGVSDAYGMADEFFAKKKA